MSYVYVHKVTKHVLNLATDEVPEKYGKDNYLKMQGSCPYDKWSLQDNGDGTGTYIELPPTVEEMMVIASDATLALIQAKIDEFNSIWKTTFANVYTCKSYKDELDYNYNQFCGDIFTWNKNVWNKADDIRQQVFAGTMTPPATIDEYLAMLPVYTGTMERDE